MIITDQFTDWMTETDKVLDGLTEYLDHAEHENDG